MNLEKTTLEIIKSRSIPDEKSDCILWAGSLSQSGYPYIRIKHKTYYAHKVLWIYNNREIKYGEGIGRTCNNRSCININHLRLVKLNNPNPFKRWNDMRKK